MNSWNDGVEERHGLFDQIAVVGKAFASAKRLEIVDLLTHGERTVEEIAGALELKTSTASAHLQILRLSNLVRTRREGPHVHYRLAGPDVVDLYERLYQVAVEHSAEVERALDAYLGTGEVDLVSHEELLQRMEHDDIMLIDVREAHEYAESHLPGAVNIPFGQLLGELGELDALAQDKEVIAYCRGAFCVLAHDAVRLLTSQGRPATRMRDGIREWRDAGYPLEVGA